jgi:hypothetical protein
LNLKAPPSCGGVGELQAFTKSWAKGQIAKNPTECARMFRVTTGGFGYRALSTTLMIATGSMQLLQNGTIIMARSPFLTIAGEPLRG